MATLAPQITAAGIVAPDQANILAQLRILYWTLYGADANLDPDTQDGQFLAALSVAISDSNQAVVAAFNSYRPGFAVGAGLASIVKINGIQKLVPTNSQAVVTLVGQVGTIITNGIIGDNLGLNTQWALPASVTIPAAGQINVTATCTTEGAVAAAPASLTEMLTPTRGWQSVTNEQSAEVGNPAETDAELRRRQTVSTAGPAQTVLEAIYSAVANIAGVDRLAMYENDTDSLDEHGIPPHSICAVVQGGDSQEIGEAIAAKKSPGTGTFGNIRVDTVDQKGVPDPIYYQLLVDVPLEIQITIKALNGYVGTTAAAIKQAVADFVNDEQAIGEDSYIARLYTPANLGGLAIGATFVVTAIKQARMGGILLPININILFKEGASVTVDDIEIVVT